MRCSGKNPLCATAARPTQGPAENRRDVDQLPNAVTSSGPARRVGVKLKLVAFPAERTAPLGYCDSDKGDKVLKLL